MTTDPVTAFNKSDPLSILSVNMRCDVSPEIATLTTEQKCALHEFFHEVLAAGYRLYQVVPAKKAAPIIKKKFGMMVDGYQKND
jgi:hypothetical protein